MDHHQPHWIDKENEKKLLWKVHSKPEIGPIGTSLSLCLLPSIEHLLCARRAIVWYIHTHTMSFGIYIVLFKPFIIHPLEMGTVFPLIFKWENWGSVRLNKATDSTQVCQCKARFSLTTLVTTPWRAVWSLGTEARRAEVRVMMIWFRVPQDLPGKRITCRFWWPIAAYWAGLG